MGELSLYRRRLVEAGKVKNGEDAKSQGRDMVHIRTIGKQSYILQTIILPWKVTWSLMPFRSREAGRYCP